MKKVLKVLKWLGIGIILILIGVICYIRFDRVLDKYIYSANPPEEKFESIYKHQELFLNLKDKTKIHAALFQQDSIKPKASVFLHLGNGMDLNQAQELFKPLIENGYQIFTYERRGYGGSSGNDDNSRVLKEDALEIFDQFVNLKEIKGTAVIIWGVSIGGIFATANAAERNDKIKGLIIDSAFNSFPEVAKFYAGQLHLENYKWLIPILLNNDFPTNEEIKRVTKPVVIVHSSEDKMIPFEFGKDNYENSNKKSSEFWIIKGQHAKGILNYTKEYISKFDKLLTK
jgi:hypothetical protein